jgi:hypothetical protein
MIQIQKNTKTESCFKAILKYAIKLYLIINSMRRMVGKKIFLCSLGIVVIDLTEVGAA